MLYLLKNSPFVTNVNPFRPLFNCREQPVSIYLYKMSTTKWKAAGVNNLTDARYFNALEAGWIEFVFDVLQPQAVTIEKARSIIEWLYEPQLVAAFGLHQDQEEIFYVLTQSGISYAAVPFEHPLVNDPDFAPLAMVYIQKEDIRQALAIPNHPLAWTVALTQDDVQNETLTEQLKALGRHSELFLQLPADPEIVQAWHARIPEAGIQLQIASEEKAGWSSVDVYDTIIEAVSS